MTAGCLQGHRAVPGQNAKGGTPTHRPWTIARRPGAGGIVVALRQREHCVGTPHVAAFDDFAPLAPTRSLLMEVAARCGRLGVPHTDIWDVAGFGTGFDIPDPDGVPVRVVRRDPDGHFCSGFRRD